MRTVGLYVILVQYGSWLPLFNGLHWLVAAGQELDRTVVVADGPAMPPSPWPTRLKGCRLIVSSHNIGFAAACNVGLRQAMDEGAEAVLVLNPHCFFGPEMLSRLWAGRTSTWQCVAPEIYRAGEPARLWFGGAWRGRLPGTVAFRKALDPRFQVDYLWACALLAGRAVWEAVGLFDEAHFLYYEDMEWCDRARAFGAELCVVPQARVWHAPGASSGGEESPLRRYHLTHTAVAVPPTRRSGLRHPTGTWHKSSSLRVSGCFTTTWTGYGSLCSRMGRHQPTMRCLSPTQWRRDVPRAWSADASATTAQSTMSGDCTPYGAIRMATDGICGGRLPPPRLVGVATTVLMPWGCEMPPWMGGRVHDGLLSDSVAMRPGTGG